MQCITGGSEHHLEPIQATLAIFAANWPREYTLCLQSLRDSLPDWLQVWIYVDGVEVDE